MHLHYRFGFGFGHERFYDLKCADPRCITTQDRSNYETFDAVVFFQRSTSFSDFPKKRLPNQRYAVFLF